MLNVIYRIAALPLTVLVYLLNDGLSLWWCVPIYLGMYLFLNFLHIFAILIIWIFLPAKRTPERPISVCRGMIWISMGWICSWLRMRVRTEGAEKLPNEPCVIVSNHISAYDPLVLIHAVGKEKYPVFISKQEVFKVPVVGRYMRCGGFLPLDRSNALRAARTLQDAGITMQKSGVNVGIYPEGTRSRTGKLLRFKDGGFVLAQRAGAPIVVTAVKGTDLAKKRFPWRSTKVTLKVLGVIDKETVKSMSTAELSAEARRIMEEELGQ